MVATGDMMAVTGEEGRGVQVGEMKRGHGRRVERKNWKGCTKLKRPKEHGKGERVAH